MTSLLLHQDPVAKEVVKDAWGDWLSTDWTWDWWVTHTFDPRKLVPGSASHTAIGWQRSQACWDAWLSEITDGLGLDGLSTVYWFRGREPNPFRYGTHFHALIGGVKTVSRRDAWRSWFDRNGHSRIEPYDPARGAGWYVAKYVVKELGELRFSDNAGQFRIPRGDAAERAGLDAARSNLPGGWVQPDPSRHVPPW
jgi:hypothetical protein